MSTVIDLTPSVDRAPNLASRLVTVNLATITEGTIPDNAERTASFRLVGDIHASQDRVIVGSGYTAVVRDGDSVRLPVWTAGTGEWAIEVKKSWAPHPYYIRVPAGSGSIDLSQINPLSPVDQAVAQWLLTNASVTATEGPEWGASVSVAGGNAHFDFTFPPGGVAWQRGTLTTSADPLRQQEHEGMYRITSPTNAGLAGMPEHVTGTLWVEWMRDAGSAAIARQRFEPERGARTWTRSSGASGWTAWEREDSIVDSAPVATNQDWDTLVDGRVHKVTQNLTPAQAAAVHAPGDGRWFVLPLLNVGYARIQIAWPWTVVPGRADMFYRAHSDTGWSDWESLKGASRDELQGLVARVTTLENQSATAAVAASGFKQVGLPLTAGHIGEDAPLAGTFTIPLSWLSPMLTITRFKIRLRNINSRTSVTRPGTVTLDGVWLDNVKVADATSFDGAAGYESPWIDVPAGTLHDKSISYSYETSAAPWAMLTAGQYNAARNTPGGSTSAQAAFSVDLIVETYATTPVIAVVGDSNSVGVGATYMAGAWPVKLAQEIGAIPQLLGSSGDTLAASTDGLAFKWARFAGCAPADATLLALGQNDAAGTTDLSTLEGYAAQVASLAHTVGRRVYGVSLMPRATDARPEFETRRRSMNSWHLAQQWGLAGYIDIVPAMSGDDSTILPEYDADGIHLNNAGTAAVAGHVATGYRVTTPPVAYVTL